VPIGNPRIEDGHQHSNYFNIPVGSYGKMNKSFFSKTTYLIEPTKSTKM